MLLDNDVPSQDKQNLSVFLIQNKQFLPLRFSEIFHLQNFIYKLCGGVAEVLEMLKRKFHQ